jgi:hypothetical protein
MVPVAGWNWCHRCGHRAEGRPELIPVQGAPEARKPGAGASELGLAARLIPLWFWVLLGGLGVVAGISCAADLCLPMQSWERATWSTAQALLGLAAFLLAGVAVSGRLGRHRSQFTMADLLLPDRLWPRAVKCLPQTRWHVCAAAWSVALALCGLIWVGGWTYWFPTGKAPSAGPSAAGKYLRDAAAKKDETPARQEAKPDAQEQAAPRRPRSPRSPRRSPSRRRRW